jgi:hypothetical protein
MADRILFIGWNRVVAGREQQAMQLWQKSMAAYVGYFVMWRGQVISSMPEQILS